RLRTSRVGNTELDPEEGAPYDRYARQIPAVGKPCQHELRILRVGIVGLGGLGSLCALQLAYAGVRNFVLVDYDVVDASSLNRLVGAAPADIDVPKTTVMEREIRRIVGSDTCEIQSF